MRRQNVEYHITTACGTNSYHHGILYTN